jgi:hypothetical protein
MDSPSSILMSDEEAETYLDGHIEQLKRIIAEESD